MHYATTLLLSTHLNERTRRIWAATEAKAIGYGGTSFIARATKISRRAILVGIREIESKRLLPEGRVRQGGGGRKSVVYHQPTIIENLKI